MLPLMPQKLFRMREAAVYGERAAKRRWNSRSDQVTPMDAAPVAIRRATAADSARLVELAQLDEAPLPEGPVLVAEEGGEIEAALPLEAGRPFSDPFRPTTALLDMLDLRAAQLGMVSAGRRAA